MTFEIERRFIARVARPDALENGRVRRLEQAYLSTGEPGVRVRRAGEIYTLTVKAGQGRVRQEVETQLPPETGAALLQMAGARRLNKTRYTLDRWEIDFFEGPLAGLILAEAELISPTEPLPPVPDGVLLVREVTDDGRYVNQCLAALDADAAGRLVQESLAAS